MFLVQTGLTLCPSEPIAPKPGRPSKPDLFYVTGKGLGTKQPHVLMRSKIPYG